MTDNEPIVMSCSITDRAGRVWKTSVQILSMSDDSIHAGSRMMADRICNTKNTVGNYFTKDNK